VFFVVVVVVVDVLTVGTLPFFVLIVNSWFLVVFARIFQRVGVAFSICAWGDDFSEGKKRGEETRGEGEQVHAVPNW